uniref:Venom POBP 1 n=1 Tax=Lethocerus distinctifemur TaxID=280095 RepID=A0A2K8JL41_9HEMI|nr:venom POBP 1 [Lethocerus distinctifemur]
MKSLLFLFGILAVVSTAPKINDDAIEDIRNAVKHCQKDEDISYEKFRSFYVTDALPSTTAEKCFVSCAAKHLGAIKNGRFDMHNIKAFNRKKYNDAGDITKADNIAEACDRELPKDVEDECEYAFLAVKCIKAEAKKHHF